jgi:ribonuclease HII
LTHREPPEKSNAGTKDPCLELASEIANERGSRARSHVLPVAGLDEAGRGPLAGPVVASAVVLDPEQPIHGLNDSKKLSKKARESLFTQILDHALAVGIGVVEAERIDQINILRASLEAMSLALEKAEAKLGTPIEGAIVDGTQLAPLPDRVRQRAVIGADRLSPAVMAASIVAKVTRDRRMIDESAKYPDYGFDGHKGYPTASHRQVLMDRGPCPLHRRSFAPVRKALEAQNNPRQNR